MRFLYQLVNEIFLVFCLFALVSSSCGNKKTEIGKKPERLDKKTYEKAIACIDKSLKKSIAFSGDNFPVATEKGIWQLGDDGWTGGYFAGMQWMMYQETGDEYWKEQAGRYTRLLEHHKDKPGNMETGILFWPSFDLAYDITGEDYYLEVGLEGARTMMKRYIPGGGYFHSWGKNQQEGQTGFVIIDCLINLDHIYWAFGQTGDSTYLKAADSHARRSSEGHIRADGSSVQVVEFNPENGDVVRTFHKQGYSDESTWSRGQSWAIYGFTRAYKFTGDIHFLDYAIRVADWYINHLPEDYIPYWDFDAPKIPDDAHDTSAASLAASALIELSTYVNDKTKAELYFETASRTLASLTENYLTSCLTGENDGVLTGSTYFYDIGRSVDQANIWGDFYYLEALRRWKALEDD